jgi:hypothetical protein
MKPELCVFYLHPYMELPPVVSLVQGQNYGNVDVQITGAIDASLYLAGKTAICDWATIRQYPGLRLDPKSSF